MPGCNVLNSIQLVQGIDMHKQIPPPPPAAAHLIVAVMGMADPSGAQMSTTVKAGFGFALGRQHDLSKGMYHFAANLMLPIVWAGAGNKAEFGSASVSVDVGGKAKRLAVACVPLIGINLQLDCNEPCPLPTSICDASLNTVFAGFSLADFVAGLIAGVVDSAITWVVGKIAGGIADLLGGIAIAGLGEVLALLGPEALLVGAIAEIAAGPVIHEAVQMSIGWLIGTPLGYSYTGPIPGTSYSFGPGSTYGGKLNDYIDNHLSPAPNALPPTAPAAEPLDDHSQRNDEE